MPGESITLECTVTSTTDPPNNITWKVDGQAIDPDEKQKQETSEGVVDIQGHLTLKITKKMDDETVTCEYSKDRFGDHIEAKLRVFTLKIETSEEVCNKCEGDVKLVFKESKQESPAEATVDKRIKEKIKELVDTEVTVNNSGYSVLAPYSIITTDRISKLSPVIYAGGEQVSECRCAEEEEEIMTDGNWAVWGSWGLCNTQTGKKERRRECNNPTPLNSGATCLESDTEEVSCPVNGNWGDWAPWNLCDNKTEKNERRRECDNPPPSNGGASCPGLDNDEIDCPVNGNWG